MELNMSGWVAVITGAGRGIGREMAILFGQLGASVVVAEISEATGAETAEVIQSQGGKALFVRTDVSDADSVEELVRRTREAFGPADVLVNNAILSLNCSVLETDIALWDRVTAVNLRGTFLTCKAFLPGMHEHHGGGGIVNMTSADSMPFMSAYMATKQGIAGFTRSLAAELEGAASGVRTVAFVPGVVDTAGLREAIGRLGPSLGMSPDEFFRSALPAHRAALATACLVLRYADEYHGEVVDGYTILEREEGGRAESNAGMVTAAGTTGTASVAGAAGVAQAAKAAETLANALVETEAELNKLPVFVRPMARAGFKDKAGLSVKEWGTQVRDLTDRLSALCRQREAIPWPPVIQRWSGI